MDLSSGSQSDLIAEDGSPPPEPERPASSPQPPPPPPHRLSRVTHPPVRFM